MKKIIKFSVLLFAICFNTSNLNAEKHWDIEIELTNMNINDAEDGWFDHEGEFFWKMYATISEGPQTISQIAPPNYMSIVQDANYRPNPANKITGVIKDGQSFTIGGWIKEHDNEWWDQNDDDLGTRARSFKPEMSNTAYSEMSAKSTNSLYVDPDASKKPGNDVHQCCISRSNGILYRNLQIFDL